MTYRISTGHAVNDFCLSIKDAWSAFRATAAARRRERADNREQERQFAAWNPMTEYVTASQFEGLLKDFNGMCRQQREIVERIASLEIAEFHRSEDEEADIQRAEHELEAACERSDAGKLFDPRQTELDC